MENRWFDRISDYLDGDLDADEARVFEARLEEDPELRRAVDEVRMVMEAAGRLPERVEPATDLWAGIAARLEAPVEDERSARSTAPLRARRFELTPLTAVAAALVLMVMSGGMGWLLRGPGGPPAPTGATESTGAAGAAGSAGSDAVASGDPTPPVRVVATPLPGRPTPPDAVRGDFEESQEHLAVSILELERELADRGHLLDEDTRAIVLDNLQRIDEAIREARAALGDAPDDDFLRSHLARSMTRKVRLLEDAARLTHREI